MFLFSRQAVLAGPPAETMAWASEIRAYASDKIGTEIALWSAGFGAPVGSVGWTMRVEGLAHVTEIGQKLGSDDGYHALLAKGADYFVAPAEDSLMLPVHGELGEASPPVGSIATVTSASMSGKITEAIGWSVEVAQLVEEITGNPVMVGTSGYGNFMQVIWIGVAADAAAADVQNEQIRTSDEYMAKVDGAHGFFLPGSGNRTVLSRVD
jgi:hypothetical protein